MIVNLSPVFNIPTIQDEDGFPLSGGKIFSYEAGSNSVLKATFTTVDGDVENSNPIVLDSSGTLPNAIWLTAGEAYNLVLTRDDGTTVIKGFDDVTGVPIPVSGAGDTQTIWVNVPGATYLSPTQFLVPGNLTTQFKVGNRARLTLAGGFTYGTVSAVTFSNPNTSITLLNDSTALNSSLSAADYSILIAAQGSTVDAGGVSYFDALTYATVNTVGWKIKSLLSGDSSVNTRIDSVYKVWTTTGTGSAYVITPSPVIASYTVGQIFNVKFHAASVGSPTINVNGLGAKGLFQYVSTGAKTAAIITANMTSQINYDGTDFILLDRLPAAAAAAAPRGQQVITATNVFTVPAGVTTIKVTAVGGGGGGGGGSTVTVGDIESGFTSFLYYGGSGGDGGSGIKYLDVTPLQTFNVTIGGPGTGSVTNGTAGGDTTFGASLVVGTKGLGGTVSTSGAAGYGSVADYGYFSVGFQVGAVKKGVGGVGGYGQGATGAAGAPGLCIIEW